MAQKEVYQIKTTAYDRTSKDISKWKLALQSAEDPDYPDRSQLMNLYHDIMLDGHLTAITEKRILNILNTPLMFVDGDKENDMVNALIESQAFENMLRYIIESKLFGHSLIWADFSLPGKEQPKAKLIDRRHVVPPLHVYKYKEGDNNNAGIDYTKPPYTNYTVVAGRDDDLGLLLKCAPWVLYKRGDIADWATFAEVFGMPTRVIKYPEHNPKAKGEADKAAEETGSAAVMTIPNSMEVEFVQNTTSTTGKGVHQMLAEFANREMSKIILANTMTTDAEGGNYKGEVHAESENIIFEADRRYALRILNSQCKRLLEVHGYKPGNGSFRYVDEDSTSIKDRIEIDLKVNQAVEIPPEYFYERYNIPVPEGGAKAREQNTQPAQDANMSEPDDLGGKRKGFRFFG